MRDPFFSDTLLRYYADFGRDLPWRRTRDPYAIWLSEIILQQTRIAQGTAYWERFMQRFPTVHSLAEASEDEVLRLWEGLGYYSRARNLHAAARQIVSLGHFPDTLDQIRSLKGVGDYTAAAIASIAFDLDAAVLDGNVYRLLARYFGLATPIGTGAAKKEFSALASALLPPGQAAAFNQGMMDFGAQVCTPSSPACTACPLSSHCRAFREGRVSLLPVKKTPAAVQERRFSYLYLLHDNRVAIRRRGAGDIWQGLWEPLVFASSEDVLAYAPTAQLLRSGLVHLLTHRRLVVDFYLAEVLPSALAPALPEGYRWVAASEVDHYAKPRLFELLLEAVDAFKTASSGRKPNAPER